MDILSGFPSSYANEQDLNKAINESLEKASKYGAPLTGGRWVTIDGRHVYIGKGGKVEAGTAYGKDGEKVKQLKASSSSSKPKASAKKTTPAPSKSKVSTPEGKAKAKKSIKEKIAEKKAKGIPTKPATPKEPKLSDMTDYELRRALRKAKKEYQAISFADPAKNHAHKKVKMIEQEAKRRQEEADKNDPMKMSEADFLKLPHQFGGTNEEKVQSFVNQLENMIGESEGAPFNNKTQAGVQALSDAKKYEGIDDEKGRILKIAGERLLADGKAETEKKVGAGETSGESKLDDKKNPHREALFSMPTGLESSRYIHDNMDKFNSADISALMSTAQTRKQLDHYLQKSAERIKDPDARVDVSRMGSSINSADDFTPKKMDNADFSKLSQGQMSTINAYTRNAYKAINRYNTGKLKLGAMDKKVAKFIETLTQTLNDGINAIENNEKVETVYRGANFRSDDTATSEQKALGKLAEYKQAQVSDSDYQENTIMSTSHRGGSAFDVRGEGIYYKIDNNKSGKMIQDISKYGNAEAELLFPTTTKFKVTAVEREDPPADRYGRVSKNYVYMSEV